MREVVPGLYVGWDRDCFHDHRPDWAVVHACKLPCHQHAVAASHGAAEVDGPTLTSGPHLYLDMLDPQEPDFDAYAFLKAVRYIREQLPQRSVLVHCNQGLSRSPSIALLYAAAEGLVDAVDYKRASESFMAFYPTYNPGMGIWAYLNAGWDGFLDVLRR